MKKSNLHLTIVEKPSDRLHGGYRYLISNTFAYTAFRTKKGFNQFLEIANVELEFIGQNTTDDCGLIEHYKLIGEITEESFWHLSDIPANAKQFKGLSNGSLVDCYYLHTDNGSIIYRPNPNAKEVYKPMPISEHIAYMKING